MEFNYESYFTKYKELAFNDDIHASLDDFKELALKVKTLDAKMLFAGNGASAAISAHAAVDFTKQAKVRGITFNEADLITCYSNDYGYENWMSEAIKSYYKANDVVVLTSVSGESPSIVNAAITARELGLKVTDIAPSLVPLKTKEDYIPKLQGLSLKNTGLTIKNGKKVLYEDFGEMMFTHFGVTGPMILSASAHIGAKLAKAPTYVFYVYQGTVWVSTDPRGVLSVSTLPFSHAFSRR